MGAIACGYCRLQEIRKRRKHAEKDGAQVEQIRMNQIREPDSYAENNALEAQMGRQFEDTKDFAHVASDASTIAPDFQAVASDDTSQESSV